MEFKYVADLLSYIEDEIQKNTTNNSIMLGQINLSNMINDNAIFLFIDEIKNKYDSTTDTYQILGQLKDIWNKVPWQIKINIAALCIYAQNKEQNIFITFALLASLVPIQHLFQLLH